MTRFLYVLSEDGRTPIPTEDTRAWNWWMGEYPKRQTNKTFVGQVLISTVFLGIDHGYEGNAPLLWETMVFGGVHDAVVSRYATYDEAMAGHAALVRRVELEDAHAMDTD